MDQNFSTSSNSGANHWNEHCGHGIPAGLRISHTEKNPFRRFLCCRKLKGNYGFWKWVDLELSPYYKATLLNLKAQVVDRVDGEGFSDGLYFAKTNDVESVSVDEVNNLLAKLEKDVNNVEVKI